MKAPFGKLVFVTAIIVEIIILGSCSKIGGGGGTDADDGNTPYIILDLRVTAISDSSVSLEWTATGDDADQGTASIYDLRRYHSWINFASWDSAVQIDEEPSPGPAGQTDSMLVTGLMEDSTYYFAIRAGDEAGNWNNPSNCVMAICFNDFVVDFPDSNLELAIRELVAVPTGDIHRSDLMDFVFLDANQRGIRSLDGLEYCASLLAIFLSSNPVSDMTPISNLWRLRAVQFSGDSISDVTPISGLVNLEMISFRNNPLSNISALSGLTNLHWIDLTQSGLSDIAPLVDNGGIAANDTVFLQYNPLSQTALDVQIPALEARGVTVIY